MLYLKHSSQYEFINLIALMPPLSLKCLQMSLQATFVFFCATSVLQIIILLIQI